MMTMMTIRIRKEWIENRDEAASGSSTGLNARQEQIIEVDCTGTKTIIIIIDGKDGSGGGKQG